MSHVSLKGKLFYMEYNIKKCVTFHIYIENFCIPHQSSSCNRLHAARSIVSTVNICPTFDIYMADTSYYSMTFIAVDHGHPLYLHHPGKECTENSKLSMRAHVGMSFIGIPDSTHSIQIWPLTFLGKRKQHISILLKVTNKNMGKPHRLECVLTVKLLFENIDELKFVLNPVTQLHVPHNLSHLGIKTMIRYLHKIHYIMEPTMKTITRSQVSQFCHKHLHANDFTYFSPRELFKISKYFNVAHGLIFSNLKRGKKVLFYSI